MELKWMFKQVAFKLLFCFAVWTCIATWAKSCDVESFICTLNKGTVLLNGVCYKPSGTTLCLKNDTDVAHCNFITLQSILVIFGRDVAERLCYRIVICYPTSPNCCLCTTWGHMNPGNCLFSDRTNWIFTETTHIIGSKWKFARRMFLGTSCKVRISSESIKQFLSCGGWNFLFLIDLAIGLCETVIKKVIANGHEKLK